jgi:tRNA/tmRNA/rRNA uracil-C5-methylase (TrmA/RlmC/RlmD family)
LHGREAAINHSRREPGWATLPGSYSTRNSERSIRRSEYSTHCAASAILPPRTYLAGLSLAAACAPRSVRFVEINGASRAPFERSAARLRREWGLGTAPPDLEYHVASAGSAAGEWLAGADVAVVDPPRKGLETVLLQHLCSIGGEAVRMGDGGGGPPPATPPPGKGVEAGGGAAPPMRARLRRLIYLSCGFPAFKRDCSALLESGRWRLAAAEGHIFFPGADHIETLAIFDRVDAS